MNDSGRHWHSPSEREHWHATRETLDALAARGDSCSVPRPVDHSLEFPSVEAMELFLEAARLRGYGPVGTDAHGEDGERRTLSLRRVDRVEIEHIHRVVMDLVELAAPYDGDHRGWEVGGVD